MKNFCCAFDLFSHRRQLRLRRQRHFLKNCNSILLLLLFVCSGLFLQLEFWGLQHAAGFQLESEVVVEVAQCAQWSFVTVIPVHFLVVLDQFVSVRVCVYLNSANNTTQHKNNNGTGQDTNTHTGR